MDSPVEPDEIRAMALEYELKAVAEQIEDVRSLLKVKDAEVALKYRLIDNKEQEKSRALWRIQQMQEEQEGEGPCLGEGTQTGRPSDGTHALPEVEPRSSPEASQREDSRLQEPSRSGEPGPVKEAHLQARRPKRFDIIDPTSGKHIDVAGLRGASRLKPTIETADSICSATRKQPSSAAPRVFSPSGSAAPPLMLPPVVHGVPPLPPAPPLGIAPGPASFGAIGVSLEPPVFPTLLTSGPAWPMSLPPSPLSLSSSLLPSARDCLPGAEAGTLAPRYHPAAHVLAPGELSKPGSSEDASLPSKA